MVTVSESWSPWRLCQNLSLYILPICHWSGVITMLPGRFAILFDVAPGCLRGLVGSTLDHRLQLPEFESRRGHIWSVCHLWLHFITFGGHSAHLAYHVHKSGRKTSIIIIIDAAPPNQGHTGIHRHLARSTIIVITRVDITQTQVPWFDSSRKFRIA